MKEWAGQITSNWSRRGYCHGLCYWFQEIESPSCNGASDFDDILLIGSSTNACQLNATQLNWMLCRQKFKFYCIERKDEVEANKKSTYDKAQKK